MIRIGGIIARDGSNLVRDRLFDQISNPVNTGSNAHGIIIDEANSRLYVTNSSLLRIYTISTSGLTLFSYITIGSGPVWLDIDYLNNRLIVIEQSDGSIRYVDLTSFSISAAISTLGSQGQGIALDLSTNRLFVNDQTNNGVRLYTDYPTLATVSTIITGLSLPHGIKIDSLNNRLYVSNFTGTGFNYYNLTTYAFIGSISGFTNASGIALTRSHLFVSDYGQNLINIYDRFTLNFVAKITGLSGNVGIAISEKLRLIFVANYNSANITRITY